MKTSLFAAWLLPLVHSSPLATVPGDYQEEQRHIAQIVEKSTDQAFSYIDQQAAKLRARGTEPTCTADNLAFRREYGALSEQERLDFISAVKCLQKLPARTPPEDAAGAKSRFDDFIMVHINQTAIIHFTGNFQPWHRWFIYLFEKALRDECGYPGYLPYWDWPRYASAPQDSPIFDGSPTSLGGNGEYVPHEGITIVPPEGIEGEPFQLPPGIGGGYVTTGPFANMTVNLGPFEGLKGTPPGPDQGLGYNPRRLKRDLNPTLNQRAANYSTVLKLLRQPDVEAFRGVLEGVAYTPDMGPHGNIHYTISGDPGADLFTSPGDPAFYLHHGMMDRMWSYWQQLDAPNRFAEEEMNGGPYGHVTWANNPPSRKASFKDSLDMLYVGDDATIGEVMDTLSGPFCYFYL